MILVYLVAAALAVATYVFTPGLTLPWRLVIALSVFLIPSLCATAWILRVGDKAPPDAVSVRRL